MSNKTIPRCRKYGKSIRYLCVDFVLSAYNGRMTNDKDYENEPLRRTPGESAECIVGRNFRQLRERAGLTMPELALRMAARGFNWSKATIWKIETGERQLKVTEAIAAIQAMGLDLDTAFPLLVELNSQDRRARQACDAAVDAVEQMLDCVEPLERAKIEMYRISMANDPGWIDADDFDSGMRPENVAMPSKSMLDLMAEVENALTLEKVGEFIQRNIAEYTPEYDYVDVVDGELRLIRDERGKHSNFHRMKAFIKAARERGEADETH